MKSSDQKIPTYIYNIEVFRSGKIQRSIATGLHDGWEQYWRRF
jgi:hypothetical protein